MRIRPDADELLATVLVAVIGGLVVLVTTFAAHQVVTGQLTTADILHRLPEPVAAVFVDDPDVAMTLDCDDLDETDPDAVARYADEHGLTVEHVPAGGEPERLTGVEWVHWRDRLVAYAEGELPPSHEDGTACPG